MMVVVTPAQLLNGRLGVCCTSESRRNRNPRTAFGMAPVIRSTTPPPLKKRTVGIDRMSYLDASPGFSSTLTLARVTRPPEVAARSRSIADSVVISIGRRRSERERRAAMGDFEETHLEHLFQCSDHASQCRSLSRCRTLDGNAWPQRRAIGSA